VSRRKWVVGAVAIAVLLVFAITVISTLRYGFSAHDEPTLVEARIARTIRHWAVPSDLRERTNPIPVTPEVLTEARAHFADHCAVCHGNDGRGQGGWGKRCTRGRRT
jgi:hypothetical protein